MIIRYSPESLIGTESKKENMTFRYEKVIKCVSAVAPIISRYITNPFASPKHVQQPTATIRRHQEPLFVSLPVDFRQALQNCR